MEKQAHLTAVRVAQRLALGAENVQASAAAAGLRLVVCIVVRAAE